jgi:phosphoribosylformylglycinamidine synthase subunit PurSL
LLRARDAKLYTAITDCGAGGLSSAVGEMAQHPGGVDVELSDVPLKYPGLHPWEIWLSEAQERMVIAIPSKNWDALKKLCDDWDVEATDIGAFTNSGKVIVRYSGKVVADMALEFLHDGLPRMHLKATATPKHIIQDVEVQPTEANAQLLRLLSNPNIASKEDIIRRYDHEVRSGTVIKPLIGRHFDGPSDGTVMKPIETPEHNRGYALGVGFAIELGKMHPRTAAQASIEEAICNIVAVGADPDQIALLDNFCWGDPKDPERLGALVEVGRACYETAVEFGTPFISGKDSLNNTYIGLDGKRISIPDTLVISAIGLVPNVTKTVTMDFKRASNFIYRYYPTESKLKAWRSLHRAIQDGYIMACHNISDSLAVSLAEMCVAGTYGANINTEVATLFEATSYSDFIIEVSPDADIQKIFTNGIQYLGQVTEDANFTVTLPDKKIAIHLPVSELTAAYKRQDKYLQTEYSHWAL